MASVIIRGVGGAGAAEASPSPHAKCCLLELVCPRKCISRGHLFVCGNASADATRSGLHGVADRQRSTCLWWSGFKFPVVLYLLIFTWLAAPSAAVPLSLGDVSGLETRTLRLGQELMREKLAFSGGQCIYDLVDLKDGHWYEVKISYPASTPADFSLDLLPEFSEDSASLGRKLLNTEKIIFRVNKGITSHDTQGVTKCRVLLTVKPAGFVAKPLVQEQPFIVFNIMAEEVVLGIPLQAFWVALLGVMAILASLIASRQLVPLLCSPRVQLNFKTYKEIL